jgi:hypothetical protein
VTILYLLLAAVALVALGYAVRWVWVIVLDIPGLLAVLRDNGGRE